MAGLPEHTSYLILLAFFLLLGLFSTVLSEILMKFATNLGVRNHSEIRWSTAKPSLGGILFFVAFLLSMVFFLAIHSENRQFNNLEFFGMVAVCTLAFIMGLADDAYNTKPWLKFFVQFICGVLCILTGNYIRIFPNDVLNYTITIFWFVGIMNSLNMLDNMDAITTVVSISSSIFMLVIAYLRDGLFNYEPIIVLGVLAGLVAFILKNWHPAKMYMGDSGSQFLGAFLGFMAIKSLWNVPLNDPGTTANIFRMLLPVSFFIITISDTSTVFINRISKKQSPFVGGKDHTTHHLVYAGMPQRIVAQLYFWVSVSVAILGICIYHFELYHRWDVILGFGLILVAIFVTLFIVTKKFKNESAEKE